MASLANPVKLITPESEPSLFEATHLYSPMLFVSMLSKVRLWRPFLSCMRTLPVRLSRILLFRNHLRLGAGTPDTLQTNSSSSPSAVGTSLSVTVTLGGYWTCSWTLAWAGLWL